MTLVDAKIGEEYIIKGIATDDEELNSFLFSLGCYSGEPITVVSRKKRNEFNSSSSVTISLMIYSSPTFASTKFIIFSYFITRKTKILLFFAVVSIS